MKKGCYVARNKMVAARMLGDEMMVMSALTSTLFTLNDLAAVIWNAADGVTPLSEIVSNKICTQFDVAPETALQDAEVLVEQLANHGILVRSDTPILQATAPLPGAR
jgi:Coenzyme PQQ synthesis protein D (PqqD)